jgi:hypothetical protein
MEKQRVNLIICTPGHSMMSTYVKSLLAATQKLSEKGITWAWSSEYSSHVGDAREMTLNGGPQNEIKNTSPFRGTVDYDKILWIDSDIAFTPEDVIKAYESDKDILSGAYLLADGTVTAYPKRLEAGYTYEDILKMEEPLKVYGVGFGFICVKKGVFEKLSRPWFQSVPVTMTDAETKEEFTFPIMGEDISWCERVHQAGFDVWLDPSIRLTHHKMMKLTWEGIRP